MSLDNFLTHGETKPPPFTKHGFSIRRKVPWVFLIQDRSIVMNLEDDLGGFYAYADGNHGVFLGILNGMLHEIDDDLREPCAIGVQHDQLWGTGERNRTSGNGLLLLDDLTAEGSKITRTRPQGSILCTKTAQINLM